MLFLKSRLWRKQQPKITMSAVPKAVMEMTEIDEAKTVLKAKTEFNWSRWVPILTLIAVVIGFSLVEDSFLTQRNLTNLSRQVAVNCILAFGMTCIILLGAIDLSIGSVLALGSVVASLLQVNGGLNQEGVWGAIITIFAVLAVCGSVGAFTGGMVSRFKMPPFVVSLGVFVIARGIALILSNGTKISPLSEPYRWIGHSFVSPALSLGIILAVAGLWTFLVIAGRSPKLWLNLGLIVLFGGSAWWVFAQYQGIPTPVLVMCIIFGVTYFILNKTTIGRFVYAIGGNPEAARLCGIRVSLITFLTFTYMGLLVALAAIIEGGRLDAGDPTAGNLYELDAIAAVVIGGTSLTGGIGTVGGTLLGAFLMGTVNNGMSLMNIPTNWQMVIKGLIIIGAVLTDVLSKKNTR